MGLQSSGSISLSDIAGEFGGSTPHSLSEYYDAASGVPASGAISLANFYGTSSSPLGFIDLHSAANVLSNIDFGSTTYIEGSLSNIVAVTKGNTEYIVALTAPNSSVGEPNMVGFTYSPSSDAYGWYGVCGTYQSGRVNTQGGGQSGGFLQGSRTRMNRWGSLVLSEPFNAVTLWIQPYGSEANQGVYRDYVNSPSEAPNADYWRPCNLHDAYNQTTNFPNQTGSGYNHRHGILGYASSETSTIVLPHIPSGADSGDYYESNYFRPVTLAVYRTTNGYDYYLNSTTTPFPNQTMLVHYGEIGDGDDETVAWKPTDIAYGNGVYVMTRTNWALTYNSNYWHGNPDSRMGMLISTNDGQTFDNTQLRFNNGSGYWSTYNPFPYGVSAVAYNHDDGLFIVCGVGQNTGGMSFIYESVDGINWTKVNISGTTNRNVITSPRSMTYGNGMFIIENYSGAYYSTDNGRNWTSISNTPTGAIVSPNYNKDLSYFVSTGYNQGDNVYKFHRFE